MSISGNLKTMELAELLQWLSQGQKSGTLVIDNGEVEKRIFFGAGKIVSASSSDPKQQLGHFLVSQGLIDEEALRQALSRQEASGDRLGKVLTDMGALSESDLRRMLRFKMEEGLYEIFSWPEGEFRFVDGKPPPGGMVPLTLDVTGIVLEGMRRVDEWRRIRQRIPSRLGVPVAVGELRAFGDDPGARQILELVDDQRTIEEIALESHASEFFVCKVLYDQLRAGRLKVVRPRVAAAPEPPPAAGGQLEAGALLAKAQDHLAGGGFEAALRHLRAARALEPDNRKLAEAVQRAEAHIQQQLERAGISPDAVPRLNRSIEELSSLAITPQEGFILSRIDGSYDIGSILKISPMPSLEAQVVFWKLLQAGHIRV